MKNAEILRVDTVLNFTRGEAKILLLTLTLLVPMCSIIIIKLVYLLFYVKNITTYSGGVYETVHRNTIMKVTNKMQLYRLIYYS